jgi:hypothetical protein
VSAAEAAAHAAQQVAADAKAVERELPNAEFEVRAAKSNLLGCDEDIIDARGLILIEEEAQFLDDGARLAAQLRAWRVRAKTLRLVLDSSAFGHRRLGVASR